MVASTEQRLQAALALNKHYKKELIKAYKRIAELATEYDDLVKSINGGKDG